MNAADKDAADGFETHRRYLTGLAYRMLGSLAEAQDVVQEAYLRWHRAVRADVVDARAFLSRTATRLCLDQLKSARVRHEDYIGPWLPEPIVDDAALAAERAADYTHDLSVALMMILERLSPLERAAFLLHDVFDLHFDEVAATLDRSAIACRQLAARARARVRASRPRFRPSQQECERLASAFGIAAQSGDATTLAKLLADDVIYYADAGGRATSARRPIVGRDKVTRLIAGLAKKGGPTIQKVRPSQINGAPGFIIERPDGEVLTMAFDFRDGLIANIYVVINPDKLRHLRKS
jgi:RNA polymerase sigma-70 factor (ECF subfamily)